MEGFFIVGFNMYHPSKDVVPVMVTDDDENTLVFEHRDEAVKWICKRRSTPYSYVIIDVSELKFEISD
jgi:hypothetical protein